MSKDASDNIPIPDLLSSYIEAAKAHGEASTIGDYQAANKQTDIISAIYRNLRHRGRDAQNVLLTLLCHDDISVRGWAATHALEFAPNQGRQVLEDIKRLDPAAPTRVEGLWRLNAEMTLREWENGSLNFL